MPEGYGYSPEGLARYRKDQEQKRTLGSTDAPRITASPSTVRPRVQRKTDPNPLAHFAEMFANLGGKGGRMSDQDLERVRKMIPTLFDTPNVSQDKLGNLEQFSKSFATLGEELGRKSDVDVRRAKRRNKVLPR
jgi:hypothetical protein